MKQTARIIRNNVPLTLLPNGTTYGEPLHCPTVDAARLLPDPPPPCISIGSAGAAVTGTFYWDSASTGTDDSQTFIKVAAITTGRYRPVSISSGGGSSGLPLSVATIPALKAILSTTLTDTQPATVQTPGTNWVWSVGTGAGFESDDITVVRPNNILLASNGRWYNTSPAPVVPTFAAARLAVSGKQPTISIQARSSLNDGGGGTFDYDASDTTTADNDGIVIVAGTRRYKRRNSSPVDAAWFGVVASTSGAPVDVAPAMQAAINATPRGGTLRIRTCDALNGRAYRLKSSNVTTAQGNYALYISKQITIDGEGAYHRNNSSAVWFICDANIGGIYIAGGVSSSVDGRFSVIKDIAIEGAGPAVGSVVHGIFTNGRFHVERLFLGEFRGCGFYADGSGVGNNINSWTANDIGCDNNGQHGWYITGNDANAGRATGIDCNENDGVGIFDSSFLGNTYVACQVAINGGAAVGQGPSGEHLGYKVDEVLSATVFLGCYAEDDQWLDLAQSAQWIGSQNWGHGPIPGSSGQYVMPQDSLNIGFKTSNYDGGRGHILSGVLAPADDAPTVISFKLPNLDQGGTRDRGEYKLGVFTSHIEQPTLEGYGFFYSDSFDNQAFFLSAEAFSRGPGRMVFCNGYYHRTLDGTKAVWRFVHSEPVNGGNGVHIIGDTLEYATPVSGGYKGRVCTRGGVYGATVQRSTAYTLGVKITPDPDNGHVYTCTTAGTTDVSQPAYNTGGGSTTTDGTAVFTEGGISSIWGEFGYIGTGGGPTGATGADGATWRSGDASTLATNPGVNGDFFLLNTGDGEVYKKAGGTYSLDTTIKGPTGSTGATGPAGAQVRRKDAITAATSYGFAGSSPDLTLTSNWTIVWCSADGDHTVTLKRTGATDGAVIEFALWGTGEVSIQINDEARGDLGTLSGSGVVPATVTTPMYASFMFVDSTDGWVPLDRGDLE